MKETAVSTGCPGPELPEVDAPPLTDAVGAGAIESVGV